MLSHSVRMEYVIQLTKNIQPMTTPNQYRIDHAIQIARLSPCRSKRGVTIWDPATGASRGHGFSGPPADVCPGRQICAGKCGQISVHAEVRALRYADRYREQYPSGPYDLLHVELATDGSVVACDGPSCLPCAAQILDVGFIGGVWLYEMGVPPNELAEAARRGIAVLMRPYWRRYTATEFYRASAGNCGVVL